MRIGLYFGSFNPVHNGHLIIANYAVQLTDMDEVWFVVSPQNPFKKSNTLLNEQHRLNLLRTALSGETRLKASDVEFKLPKPSYTINTLAYLKEKYPQHEFCIIMGSDGYNNITEWKNGNLIVDLYNIYIYVRHGFEEIKFVGNKTKILEAPLLDISSTFIRKLIAEKKSIRYFVPDAVKEEIDKQLYYASSLENPSKKKTG